jgi:hypothetical protein
MSDPATAVGIFVLRGSMDLSKLPKLSQTPQQASEGPLGNDTCSPAPAAGGMEHCRACGLPLRVGARFCDGCGAVVPRGGDAPEAGAAEVWISAIFGIVFILIGKTFGAYLWSLITHQPFHTGVNWTSGEQAGSEVTYPQLQGFVIWTDSGMFIFGLALLLEALAMALTRTQLRLKRAVVSLALLIAAIATAYNLVVVFVLFSQGLLPLLSLLAVAYGGYLVISQWSLFRSTQTSH